MYDKLLKCLNEKSESDAEELQWIFWMYDRSIWKWSEDEENFIDQNHLQPNRDSVGFLKDLAYWLVECDKIDRKKLEIRPFSDKLVYSDSDCTVYRSDTIYEMLLMLLVIQEDKIDYLEGILK